MQRGILEAGEQAARRAEDQAHDDADMQPSDGEQMCEAGGAKRLAVSFGNGGGRSGQQCGGDRARGARECGLEPGCDGLAQRLEGGAWAVARAVRQHLDRAEREAVAGHAGEEGVALEVPGAGIGGWGGGLHQGADTHGVAFLDLGGVVVAQADAQGAPQWRGAVQAGRGQGHAAAHREDIQRGGGTGDHHGAAGQAFRRQRAQRGELRGGEAECAGGDGQKRHTAPITGEPGGDGERGEDGGTEPSRRLPPEGEIEQRAGDHEYGQPYEQPALLAGPDPGQKVRAPHD